MKVVEMSNPKECKQGRDGTNTRGIIKVKYLNRMYVLRNCTDCVIVQITQKER